MAKRKGILSNDQQVNKNNVSDTGILSKKDPTNSLYYEYEESNDSRVPIETQERIKSHESKGGNPEYMPYQLEYKDKKENFFTVGHGHRIYGIENNPNEINRVYSDEEIETLFKQDLNIAADRVDKLVDRNKIDPTAYGILVEMAYQMGSNIEEGTGLAGFKKTLEEVNKGNYKEASNQMLWNYKDGKKTKTKWYNQTEKRAKTLSNLMANINK